MVGEERAGELTLQLLLTVKKTVPLAHFMFTPLVLSHL